MNLPPPQERDTRPAIHLGIRFDVVEFHIGRGFQKSIGTFVGSFLPGTRSVVGHGNQNDGRVGLTGVFVFNSGVISLVFHGAHRVGWFYCAVFLSPEEPLSKASFPPSSSPYPKSFIIDSEDWMSRNSRYDNSPFSSRSMIRYLGLGNRQC